MSKDRICIGIPCYAGVSAETLEDYMRFAYHIGRRYQNYDFFLAIKSKSEQFRARNAIVEVAISLACDWLLMLDDDHILETTGYPGDPKTGAEAYNFLEKLLNHNVDIVGPVYYQRGGGGKPVVMDENEAGDPYFISDFDLGHCLEERAVQGGGCILINMRVFDKIKSPWFEPEFVFGTDIQICKKAREAGFKVYNDSSIEIGHVVNERTVITSKNKDRFCTDKPGLTATQSELDWRTDSILHKYRYDAAEFLGIKQNDINIELERLKTNYELKGHCLVSEFGEGSEEYYKGLGPEQLARQVLVHHNPTNKMTMSAILQEIPQTKMVGMDFGCGSAPVGFELAKVGGKMHFIDIDGTCAYEFLKWRCKKYGLENVSFEWPEPGTLNYCMALDSIEHLSNWQYFVDKIIECLKPGGNFMTNFMKIADRDNAEHIFMDKPAFMAYMVGKGMTVNTDCVFLKATS